MVWGAAAHGKAQPEFGQGTEPPGRLNEVLRRRRRQAAGRGLLKSPCAVRQRPLVDKSGSGSPVTPPDAVFWS